MLPTKKLKPINVKWFVLKVCCWRWAYLSSLCLWNSCSWQRGGSTLVCLEGRAPNFCRGPLRAASVLERWNFRAPRGHRETHPTVCPSVLSHASAALRDLKYNAMRYFLTGKMPYLGSSTLYLVFFFFNIYLFMSVLGLRFCARAFSSCGKRGPLFIAVRGPLTTAVPPIAEHRLQTRRLSNCGSRA